MRTFAWPAKASVGAAALLLCLGAVAATATPRTLPASAPVAAQPLLPLRLIAFNDFHGHLEAVGQSLPLADPAHAGQTVMVPTGGAAALSGLIHQLEQDAPYSMVISGGDLIGAAPLISTLFRHETTIDAANRIGVDVGVVGNHEFDGGMAELRRLQQGGCRTEPADAVIRSCAQGETFPGFQFPLLGANVVDGSTGRPALAAYRVFHVRGVAVGVIGAVTRSTPSIVVPSGVQGLRFEDEAEAINSAARVLLRQGVKTLVAVIHEGGELGGGKQRADWNDASCPGAIGPIFDIAHRLLPEIQVVFSAHTHQGYRCEREGRVIIQATSYGRGVSVVDLKLDARTGAPQPGSLRSINLPVFNAITPAPLRQTLTEATPEPFAQVLRETQDDAVLAAMVRADAQAVRPVAERPVGRILGNFTRDGAHGETTAGHLVADSQWAATRASAQGGAQLALMNAGGLRADLGCGDRHPPCTVGYGDLFTMQPFGNDVVVMTLNGAQLRRLLEQQARAPGMTPAILQPSQSLRYTWTATAPAGQHVSDLTVEGEVVQDSRDYRVAVNSFMADGGDGFTVLKEGRDRITGPRDVDALVAYLQSAERQPDTLERIHWVP